MSIKLNQGFYTGLLGYSVKKEYLGNALQHREIETLTLEIYGTDTLNKADLSSYLKTTIASAVNAFSGDVNITSLSVPISQESKENNIRFCKYTTTAEIRRTGNFLGSHSGEFSSDESEYYPGPSGIKFIITGYFKYLEEFGESFSFATKEDGSKDYSHSINLTLRSGDSNKTTKTLAQEISSALFASDKLITGISGFSFYGFTGALQNYGDSSISKNYFTETYDLLKNTFIFEKKKELAPNNLGTYTHNITRSLDMGEDGIVNVGENLRIVGRMSFSQAEDGFEELYSGSYDRCNASLQNWTKQFGSSKIDSLMNEPIDVSKTLNIPALTIESVIKFSNDKSWLSKYRKEVTTTLDRNEAGYIDITDSIKYVVLQPKQPNFLNLIIETGVAIAGVSSNDKTVFQIVTGEKILSNARCQNMYVNCGYYNPKFQSSGVCLSSDYEFPTRGKSFGANFKYTTNPIYKTILDGVEGFRIIDVKVSDTKPTDIFNEIKIINRPTNKSVIDYGYQSTEGKINVSLEATLERPGHNILLRPYAPPIPKLAKLKKLAKKLALDRLMNLKSLKSTWFLSNFEYSMTSKNTISMSVEITYTTKKYRPIGGQASATSISRR